MNNITVKEPAVVISTFLWIGFVCAISFMEAWLKFQAPGITVPLGLGIGRLVFGALNKIEWVFMAAIFLYWIPTYRHFYIKNVFFFLAVLILLIQTFWLLPFLDNRAELLLRGQSLPSSNVHFWYILCEIVKVLCLFVFGCLSFTKNRVHSDSN